MEPNRWRTQSQPRLKSEKKRLWTKHIKGSNHKNHLFQYCLQGAASQCQHISFIGLSGGKSANFIWLIRWSYCTANNNIWSSVLLNQQGLLFSLGLRIFPVDLFQPSGKGNYSGANRPRWVYLLSIVSLAFVLMCTLVNGNFCQLRSEGLRFSDVNQVRLERWPDVVLDLGFSWKFPTIDACTNSRKRDQNLSLAGISCFYLASPWISKSVHISVFCL